MTGLCRKFTLGSLIGLLFLVLPLAAVAELKVMVSIAPIHSLLVNLMEGVEPPELIVPADRSPIGFQPSSDQIDRLGQANLVIWVGPELESSLTRSLSSLKNSIRVETLLDNPELKILPSREDEQQRDPYFWLDTRNGIILVDELARRLMEVDPVRTHLYERNRKHLLEQVAELDRRLEYGYRGFKSGVGLNYFDTLQYFEQAYALKIGDTITSLQHPHVSGAVLLGNRAKLVAGEYRCLFLDKSAEAKDLDLLKGSADVRSAMLDVFGIELKPGPSHYFDLISYNTQTIRGCLNADKKQDNTTDTSAAFFPNYEPIKGKFMLLDNHNQLVTEKDLLGKYQLLYFGYTFCPDVCPTSLQVMSLGLDMLGDKANKIQPYFITIDPARDTVHVMDKYVKFFDFNLIGLTGSPEMIARVAKEYHVRYEKVIEEGQDPNLYLMDHTASLYLIAPDGRFITKFAHGIKPEQLKEKLDEYIPD